MDVPSTETIVMTIMPAVLKAGASCTQNLLYLSLCTIQAHHSAKRIKSVEHSRAYAASEIFKMLIQCLDLAGIDA